MILPIGSYCLIKIKDWIKDERARIYLNYMTLQDVQDVFKIVNIQTKIMLLNRAYNIW